MNHREGELLCLQSYFDRINVNRNIENDDECKNHLCSNAEDYKVTHLLKINDIFLSLDFDIEFEVSEKKLISIR